MLVAVIHFPLIPAAAFLEYDPADIPILICAFAYGPLAGLLLTVVVCFIQGFTVSAQSGIIGIVMHIFATGCCVLVTGYDLDIKVAVMGCVVNGPGEAKEADLGVAGGKGVGILIKKGEIVKKVPESELLSVLKDELDHWGK